MAKGTSATKPSSLGNSAGSGIIIHPCSCQHTYQDAKYGKFRRVHNLSAVKTNKLRDAKCTVCGLNKTDVM